MATPDPVLNSAGYLLLKAGVYMGRDFDATLSELGLTGREFLVLSFIGASPCLSQQELSERIGLDPTIIVGLVDTLEDRGLATRTRDVADRRRNVLALTPAGEALHTEASEATRAAEDEFLAPLAADERERLRVLLRTVMQPRLKWLADEAAAR